VPVSPPQFSLFPYDRIPRSSRADAATESVLARWLAGSRRPASAHLTKLIGGPSRITSVRIARRPFDPYAALAEIRIGGLAIPIAGSGHAIRALTQDLLGGVDELPAPRNLTTAEQAVWSLVVSAALVDAGLSGEVWPLADSAKQALADELARWREARPTTPTRLAHGERIGRGGLAAEATPHPEPAAATRLATVPGSRRRGSLEPPTGHETTLRATPAPGSPAVDPTPPVAAGASHVPATSRGDLAGAATDGPRTIAIEVTAELAGQPLVAVAWCPAELLVRVPPPRPLPTWTLDLPIVVARCALARDALDRLAVRDVIAVGEAGLELRIGDGAVGLTAAPQAVEATVATGYVPRDMALPDDAHLELTVRLGTARLSLRRIGELAVGEVIALGRPLAGPYEVHAGGRVIGQGELVDLDGEIGVRIVSLIEE